MTEFSIPSIIEEQTVDNIQQTMLNEIPDDIDKSEGSFVWDNTANIAVRLSYFSQFVLPEAIKTAFPKYSYDEYLDDIAAGNGLERKEATYAKGIITVTGSKETVIPLGSVFSTASSAGIESVEFETTEAATIPNSETVDIPIRCTEAGTIGNVSIGTIILKSSDLPSSIISVTNSAATAGGTDRETDDALRERIESVEQSKGISHVGSKADYKRWAESVEGVGEALVIPAQDDSGKVTIILTDPSGNPASTSLCTAVYNYIMGTKEDQSDRLVNVNAYLEVKAPTLITVAVSATVELDGSVSLADVKSSFLSALNKYLLKASDSGKVRYTDICNVLHATPGVIDYSDVKVNDATANITVSEDELAVSSDSNITLTEGA